MILEGTAGMDAIDAAIELLKNTVFPSAQLGLVMVAVEALREKRAQIAGVDQDAGRQTAL